MAVLQTLKEEKEALQQQMRAQLEKSERNQVGNKPKIYCKYCVMFVYCFFVHLCAFVNFDLGYLAQRRALSFFSYV
jgi:hypothetical protein